MDYNLDKIPIFKELHESKNILISGAGGGFDIYSGIPLYFSLKAQGKNVLLGNLSFTNLQRSTSELVFPHCYKIQLNDRDLSGYNYFPEKHLKTWLSIQSENTDVYGFERVGVNPLKEAYQFLIKKHQIDTVILIDGGTDSLMFGDEDGLGTPEEDICSMAAVHRTGIKKQYLVSVGFGIDHFHGVSHYRFLENVAEIIKSEGYLGLFQLTKDMPEAKKYKDAIEFANKRMKGMESIVSNSIISAIEGEYGNYHKTNRTLGSELWINPLMTIYWCFNLRDVIKKIKYYDLIKDVNTLSDFRGRLARFKNSLPQQRLKKQLPI